MTPPDTDGMAADVDLTWLAPRTMFPGESSLKRTVNVPSDPQAALTRDMEVGP